MPGFADTKANMDFLKKRLNQNIAAGEKLIGSEFWVAIKGYENLSILVRSAQLGEMTREDAEDYAPGGVKFNQHGVLRNSGEFQMTCVETIKGDVFKAVKQMVTGKEYVEVTVAAAAESNAGEDKGLVRKYLHCKIYSDAFDFSSEDVTTVSKLSLRVVYNWAE
ncbi:baseplate protein [Pantoea agglomerans]|uniref:baseplate protein n=1 Tax=Enterobacter agglomerans TaxID=549 RepID=UPI003C7AD3EA